MKKVVTLLAALTCVATASAQMLMNNDFEDGTAGTWKMWQSKEAKIVGSDQAKDSKHAIDLFTGGYCDIKGVKEGMTYVATADVNWKWGEEPGMILIQGYNPKSKKLENIKEVKLPTSKGYQKISITFKAKYGGYHRFTYTPTPGSPGKYVMDNMKVEMVQK